MMMTISFPEHISVIRSAIFDALIVNKKYCYNAYKSEK